LQGKGPEEAKPAGKNVEQKAEKRKRGMFGRELKYMMYGFGDAEAWAYTRSLQSST
jgi:hypothetical protein